jgi:hypothetical protein
MPERSEVAFLLGAGAVRDAGLPTAIELTGKVEATVSASYQPLMPVLRFIAGAVEFGRGCRGEPVHGNINIEELLSACMFLAERERHYAYPFVSSWHERVSIHQRLPNGISSGGEADEDSFSFLAELCHSRLREWLEIRDNADVKYLRGFLDFINRGYRLRIFTLNYDDGIERALSDSLGLMNGRWTTGFDSRGWNPEKLASDEYDAYVYKLHGSLDWVRDPKLGVCSTKWPAAEEVEELPSDARPLLIFGTDAKLQPVDPFLSLLFRFQQSLFRSTILVAIGYRFADTHVNAMILDALQRDPQMRCIVANPEGVKDLIPEASDLGRLVAVERRFVEVKMTARRAFDSNELVKQVDEVFEEQREEKPF